MMQAAEIMTRDVVTVGVGATIADAIRIMLARRISVVPVLDQERRVVGMLTEGDLLRRSEIGTEAARPKGWFGRLLGENPEAAFVRSHARQVEAVMTRDVVGAGEEAELDEVVEVMERRRVKQVPILRDGRLVGMVTRADLLAALGRALDASDKIRMGDDAIRQTMLASLQAQGCAPRAGVEIMVREGTVRLEGMITDAGEGAALRAAAEATPGVRAVEDKLVLIDPATGMAAGEI